MKVLTDQFNLLKKTNNRFSLPFVFIVTLALLYPACQSSKAVQEQLDYNIIDGVYSTKGDSCPDLYISSIRILERGKNEAIIEYTITNNGTAPVPLEGVTSSKKDNVGIQIFFSGDDKYNQGDLLVDGIFLTKVKPETNGILYPKEEVNIQYQLDLSRKTSFHSTLILHIDPLQLYRECDETNNYSSISF